MKTHQVGIAVVLLVLVPILYLFSTGPYIWLVDRGYIEPNKFWSCFYFPLDLAVDRSDTVANLFNAWVHIWRPDPFKG